MDADRHGWEKGVRAPWALNLLSCKRGLLLLGMRKLLNVCVLVLMWMSILPARAGVYFFAGTGHWYEPVLVPNGITWPDAYAAAVSRGGYLCTATNASENSFVASLVDVQYYSDVSINSDILGP